MFRRRTYYSLDVLAPQRSFLLDRIAVTIECSMQSSKKKNGGGVLSLNETPILPLQSTGSLKRKGSKEKTKMRDGKVCCKTYLLDTRGYFSPELTTPVVTLKSPAEN